MPLSHTVTEHAQANGAVDQDLSIGLGKFLPLLPARLPSPSWWHRYTPAEPAAKGEPYSSPATRASSQGQTSCLQRSCLQLPPIHSCLKNPTEEWEARIPAPGRVGSALFCSCSSPGGPQLGGRLGKQILGPIWAGLGASLLAAKQRRERCFQDCRLRGTGQG